MATVFGSKLTSTAAAAIGQQEISSYYNPETLLAIKNPQATSLCNLFDPFQAKNTPNSFDLARSRQATRLTTFAAYAKNEIDSQHHFGGLGF